MTRRAWLLAALALGACGRGELYQKREVEPGVFEIRNPDGMFRYLSASKADSAGIGIRVGRDPEGRVTILELFPGSPAQTSGLQVGDKLLTADGKPLKGLTANDAADVIRGAPGSPIKLGIQRLTEKSELVVRRADEVMQFTEFPPGTHIRAFPKAEFQGQVCPLTREPACHFLVDASGECFFSCPLEEKK